MSEQEAIKDYLLGALNDETERETIKQKMLLEDDFDGQLSIAEDELIAEYLDGPADP